MSKARLKPTIGVMAEFESAEAMLAAIERLREAGYSKLDAYTPFPVHGIDEKLGIKRSRLTLFAFIAGMIGAGGAYFVQWYMNAYDYPINVGGRPAHAPLAFLIITFEMGVLFAGVTAFISVFALSGLPRLWHPVFEIEGFERATIDRFWVSVDTDDPKYSDETPLDLEQTSPLRVVVLP
jgi:hypothetical protein